MLTRPDAEPVAVQRRRHRIARILRTVAAVCRWIEFVLRVVAGAAFILAVAAASLPQTNVTLHP